LALHCRALKKSVFGAFVVGWFLVEALSLLPCSGMDSPNPEIEAAKLCSRVPAGDQASTDYQ
jgi:hypothetical protein